MFNLLDNAVRYTPEGGRVRVAVRPQGDQVEFSVEDSGPGIAPSQRESVFERFNRGDRGDDGGFGLGLAIVREAVRACGATLALGEGAHGRGLRVAVTLRAATARVLP